MKSKFDDPLLGQRFGKLECIAVRTHRVKNGNWVYQLKCDCGSIAFITKYDLYKRGIISCGCVRKDSMRKNPGDVSFNELFNVCKRAATIRMLEFTISADQHKNLIQQNCKYCGEPPADYNFYVRNDGKTRRLRKPNDLDDLAWIKANGIDRIDSSLGYIKQNCVPCCKVCSIGKQTMLPEEWINHCKKVAKFQSQS